MTEEDLKRHARGVTRRARKTPMYAAQGFIGLLWIIIGFWFLGLVLL